MAAVAQHRDGVGDGLHLTEPVGDVEHGNAGLAQPGDNSEQPLGLDGREDGGGLVEDHDTMRHQ